jgi:hypothetical protein
MSGLEAPRLYADGPPCRHDRTWLVATETGWHCMVCGPSTRAQDGPRAAEGPESAAGDADALRGPQEPAGAVGIAPEDEGIAAAAVHAQIANDNESEQQ